jgi:hypothetical protein
MNGVRSRSEATLIFEFYKWSQQAGFPIFETSQGLGLLRPLIASPHASISIGTT